VASAIFCCGLPMLSSSSDDPDLAVQSSIRERFVQSRRTRLVNTAGENCDYIETLPSTIRVNDLRVKIGKLKKVKLRRVQILRAGSQQPLADDEEVRHEWLERSSGEPHAQFCSTGEPLLLMVLAAVRVTKTGLVKCKLDHGDSLVSRQQETWAGQWVSLSVEEGDLGPDENDELRMVTGDVDLVRYGKLKHPHAWLREWGNKACCKLAGALTEVVWPYCLQRRRRVGPAHAALHWRDDGQEV